MNGNVRCLGCHNVKQNGRSNFFFATPSPHKSFSFVYSMYTVKKSKYLVGNQRNEILNLDFDTP